MAYAQLANLPAYYGLYASFLPVIIAALFGSSRQLQTGPVAVVSLMTAAALEPLATANPEGISSLCCNPGIHCWHFSNISWIIAPGRVG